MKTEDELYNEIENYLNKNFDQNDLHSFEQKIASDPSLDYQVKLQGMANDFVIKNRLTQVADLSKNIQKQELNKQKYIRYGRLAALLLVTGISAYFLYYIETPKSINTPEEAKSQTQLQPNTNTLTPTETKDAKATEIQRPKNTDVKTAAAIRKKEENKIQESSNLTQENQPIHSNEPIESSSIQHVPNHTSSNTTTIKHEHQPVSPCKDLVIKANIHGFETCEGLSEGSINISKIQGGKQPYHFKVVSKANQQESQLMNLSSGNYIVTITDGNNCTQVFDNIVISSKNCGTEAKFNPHLGEIWESPHNDKSADLSIFDSRGKLIYKSHVSVSEKATWDGKSNDGEILTGVFVYLLRYSDGTQIQGNITVLQ